MGPRSVKHLYPWTQSPLIVCAPMGGYIASPALAAATTKAGGLGFIGTGLDTAQNISALDEAKALLASRDHPESADTLPVGIGFLCFGASVDGAVEAVKKHHPAAVWLFAAKATSDYASWTSRMREASPKTHIWVQIGSVADALEVAHSCKPEVLVCQGADAGGHGLERGAGVISLVPEIADALEARGFGDIALVASGGISEGRAVAASIALGAVGAAMGTRFLGAHEVQLPDGYQSAVLASTDGGQSTVRDKIFDAVGPKGNIWPVAYDGRAIRNASWHDQTSGVSEETNRQRKAEFEKEGHGAAGGPTSRVSIWAGTGIGHVRQPQPAGTIVEEVRSTARDVLAAASAKLEHRS